MTRQQTMQRDGIKPDMPPAGAAAHLVGILFEVGPTTPAGEGRAPIAWTDIEAWQRCTGRPLSSWEARIVRRLSAEYVSGLGEFSDPAAPAPYMSAPTTASRARVAQQLRAAFGPRASGPKHKAVAPTTTQAPA